MTTSKLWDAEFLAERERDAREAAVWQLAEADWKRALAEADRIRSNSGRRYRLCQNAACRRARSCVRDTPSCVKPASDEAAPSPLVDHLYARLQIARREAARVKKNKGRQDASRPPATLARNAAFRPSGR
jgi:hypothetical protein